MTDANGQKVRRASFLDRRWTRKTLPVRAAILQVLNDFKGSMSTRQVYYQLVSRDVLPNCEASYEKVQRLVVLMRRCGEIGYHRIVDRNRPQHWLRGWDGVDDMLAGVENHYRRDWWAEQPQTVMIGLEKGALEGIFAEEVDHYGVSLWVIRGFVSESFAYEWANAIQHQTNYGKRVFVYYFGDHDPSGLEIARKLEEGLAAFDVSFSFKRAGLLRSDIERYAFPTLPVKHSDTRAKSYLEEHGDVAAELDALPPDALRDRVRQCIERHITNRQSWHRLQETQEVERRTLSEIRRNWPQLVQGVSR